MDSTEKIPKCQFCDALIGEGFQLRQDELYVCLECWRLIETILKKALPDAIRQVIDKSDDSINNELQLYFRKEIR